MICNSSFVNFICRPPSLPRTETFSYAVSRPCSWASGGTLECGQRSGLTLEAYSLGDFHFFVLVEARLTNRHSCPFALIVVPNYRTVDCVNRDGPTAWRLDSTQMALGKLFPEVDNLKDQVAIGVAYLTTFHH